MEIDLRFATDVAASAIELKDRHAGVQTQVNKPLVAANDNVRGLLRNDVHLPEVG